MIQDARCALHRIYYDELALPHCIHVVRVHLQVSSHIMTNLVVRELRTMRLDSHSMLRSLSPLAQT